LKTVSDELFRLIKSLTRSEKGFFKKFATRNTPGEKNNYIVLFDAIDDMDNYDEDLLRKKLRNSSFASQVPVYKNYLFNMILKSLQSYSTYETQDTKINELIHNAGTLSKKALHKEALRLLKKAKQIALRFENTKAQLEILAQERSIIMTMPDKNVFENRAEIYKQQQELLKTLDNHFKFAWLSDNMVMHIEHKGDFRTEENEKEIRKILADPLMKTYTKLKDYTAKRYFLHIHLFDQLAKEDLPKIQYYIKKELELIHEYKHMLPVFIRTYIQTLVNYLLFSNLLKDRKGVVEALREINELKRRIKNRIPLDIEISILANSSYAEIIIYRNNGEMKKGRVTAKKIEHMLKEYPTEIPLALKIVLLINTYGFYFVDENYEAALRCVNMVLNEIPPSFKKDLYDFTRLFQLIVHFELGNFDVLENSVDSAYRFMKERKSIFEIEAALFSFLKKVLRTEKKNMKPVFEELLYELEKGAETPQGKITISNFNFRRWAKSNLSGRSMAEMIKDGS
jgi:hypothetical protein